MAVLLALCVGLGVGLFKGIGMTVLPLALAAGLMLVALMLVRAGRAQAAASIMLGTITAAACWLVFTSQGLHDEAISAFPGILIFASMFGTRRLFVSLLALITLVLVALVAANESGLHRNIIQAAGWGTLLNTLGIIWVTSFFVWLMASDLRRALKRLETENERIRESHARIEVMAHHDSLTGLPNRVLARDRLEQVIAGAPRSQVTAGMLFLDLDNFKTVNDSLGHAAGDVLLCEVAARLTATVRKSDTVSRQGGDEFLVLMSGQVDAEAASAAAIKLIEQLTQPFVINGLEVTATTSIGIALFPKDGADFDTLLKNADMAMYRAKDAGRNTYRFYDAEMNNSVMESLQLTSGIRNALTSQEFSLYYQPQFELATQRIIGAEALIRWKHPVHGFIPPARFIPVAERTGLMNEIGTWVLYEACRQTKAWQDAGYKDMVVAVNVSPVQFRRDDIEREVVHALSTWNLSPASIELELTESLLIAESSHIDAVLKRLRNLGVKLSIDDFGTGYSNLGYLKRFEVERLKIDQSFVRRMTQEPDQEGIVKAVVGMAATLRLETVAEGVEDQATLARLVEIGCRYGQGYHWSPPLPPDQFIAFVDRHQAHPPGPDGVKPVAAPSPPPR